jgi:hypothetical protein
LINECPKCGRINPKSALTCSGCRERLYPKEDIPYGGVKIMGQEEKPVPRTKPIGGVPKKSLIEGRMNKLFNRRNLISGGLFLLIMFVIVYIIFFNTSNQILGVDFGKDFVVTKFATMGAYNESATVEGYIIKNIEAKVENQPIDHFTVTISYVIELKQISIGKYEIVKITIVDTKIVKLEK